MGACLTDVQNDHPYRLAKSDIISCYSCNLCNDSILECPAAARFVDRMKQENDDDVDNVSHNVEKSLLLEIINDFLHLICAHNEDELEFEHIVESMGYCEICKCKMFTKMYKDKTLDVYSRIICKMHCYFCHSFDIGHRLTRKENTMVSDDNENKQQDINCEWQMKTRELLISKHNKYKQIFENRFNHKFSELSNVMKDLHNQNINQFRQYQCGYQFLYLDQIEIVSNGLRKSNQKVVMQWPKEEQSKSCHEDERYSPSYHGCGCGDRHCTENIEVIKESSDEDNDVEYEQVIEIRNKWETLKDEVTKNEISTLSVNQFDGEYHAAEIYFDTQYRKEIYPNMALGHLLTLLLYCNYDELQNKFSKTYREDKGRKHNNFWWMGWYLKHAVHDFGVFKHDNGVKRFYHGIGQKLLFAHFNRITICCPLSTTSSFAVALNFTNNNKGLIIEFEKNSSEEFQMNRCKSMSVSWLSDYGSESEYIFVQNQDYLRIVDIVEPKFTSYHMTIVKVLNDIDVFSGVKRSHENKTYKKWTEMMCNKTNCKVIYSIVTKQLNIESSMNNDLSTHLSQYTKELIRVHFEMKCKISLQHKIFSQHKCADCAQLCELFYDLKNGWFNLDLLLKLYPQITKLEIDCEDYDLKTITIDKTLEYLFEKNTKLESITIGSINTGQLSDCYFKSRYRKQIYRKFDAEMSGFVGWITVYHCCDQ
eukprot:473642_1